MTSRSLQRSAIPAARSGDSPPVAVNDLEMRKRNAKKGLATLRMGGGMVIAMCVER